MKPRYLKSQATTIIVGAVKNELRTLDIITEGKKSSPIRPRLGKEQET